MRSGLICPATEVACTDGRCKIGHCVVIIKDKLDAKQAEADKEARLERAFWKDFFTPRGVTHQLTKDTKK
jgi:hypothetical protein